MPLEVKDGKENKNTVMDNSALIQVEVVPSKFLPYPKGSKIHFKSYTYGEISKMSQSKVSSSKKIDMALKGIDTTGFNVEDLSYFDLQYISLLRRGSTFSTSDFSMKYTCRGKEVKKCGFENFEILPLTRFEFLDLKFPKLPITVKFSKKTVKFHAFTVRDYKFLEEQGKAGDPIAVLAKQTNIDPFEEAYGFIYEITGTDLRWLKKVDAMLNHGLKPFKLECRECKQINYRGVGEGDVIIMPFCKPEDTHGDVLSFG